MVMKDLRARCFIFVGVDDIYDRKDKLHSVVNFASGWALVVAAAAAAAAGGVLYERTLCLSAED